MIVSRYWQMLALLWLGALLRTAEGATFSAQQSYLAEQISERLSLRVSADGFVDTQSCYAALYEADANGDGQVSADEYVTVVQMLGPPGFEENATTIGDLPRPLKQAFNLLACLCTIDQPDSQCCVGDNAHISNEGTAPGATPTPEQEVYLFSVCLTTNEAISKTLGTRAPTTSPSASPSSITAAPTFTPTTEPTTLSPTTLPPTTIAPTTLAPVSSAPTTEPPVSNAPTTEPPVSNAPTTKPPVSTAPTTKPPTTTTPTTEPPVSTVPTSQAPVTSVPTSQAPVTSAPTSQAPVTKAPSTVAPTSTMPVTQAPTGGLYPVTVEYQVAYRNGVQTGAPNDLEQAMDILAPQVAAETFPDPRRRLMYSRRLTVGVQSTQLTGGFPVGTCPAIFSASDTCQVLQHSITLIISDEVVEVVKVEYKAKLEQAIAEGRLESSLQSVNPNSNVYIVTGVNVAPTVAPTAPPDSSGLSSGATAGIAVGAVAGVLLIALALFALRRRQAEKEDESYFPGAITATQTLSTPHDVEGDLGAEGGTLGAGQADYKIKSKASAAALVEGEIADKSAPQAEGGADSSSNAGSSGWSSSVGNSTLNSGSIDGMDEVPGSSLAAIGAASALAAGQGKKDSGVPKLPEVTRDDLDSAIEAGDWAAVGATAALLAAASDSQSYSSRSRGSTRGGSSISSLDAARAAELDHLVDAGDWEGVVVAAAKFESSEENSTSAASQTSRTAGSSGFSAASTTLSDSPSKAAKRDEIREEVENLVRRVVPEEIDNVDEMMLQFKGREEELVETLRTMQERQVAQKARVQGQKQAKRDARRAAHEGGLALPVPPPPPAAPGGVSAAAAAGIGVGVGVAAAAGVAAAVGIATRRQDDSDHASSASGSSSDTSESVFATPVMVPSILGDSSDARSKSGRSPNSSDAGEDELSSKKQRTALELAIEAGDWEAVGEAAAMMSDASVNSASTGEINRYAEGDVSTFSGDSTERFQVNALRAAELDDMIDRGDWTGVVAAASRFGGTGDVSPTAQDGVSPMSTTDTPETIAAAEKERRLKEEQEALAQADLWMEIAKQSKQEGSTDAAASDAADWAIARSLSALKTAESKGELEKQESEGDGSDDSGRSV